MPSVFRITFALLLLSIASTVVTGQTRLAQIDTPAREGSGQPNLFTNTHGRVFLSWVEKVGENRHRLRFAEYYRARWTEPRTIAEGDNWFVNWADFPSVVVLPDDQTIVAHWLVKSAPDTYAYDVKISRSTNRGRTWSKPMVPHRDGTRTEHGFVSLVPMATGRVGAVWLDGREMKEGGHDGHDSHGEMTLRFATIDAWGRISDEALLDGRACECCQTSAAMTSEGPVAVYRDRSDEEVRDISIVRLQKGRWTQPRTLHRDNWKIEGCPVNGPSIAAHSRRVAVAWFTGAGDAPRVNLAFSNDAGATFGNPIRVDDGSPLGRVEVVLLRDGAALIVWLERTEKGAEVRARRVRADGSRDAAVVVADTSAARASGFPQVLSSGDEIFFAWTEAGSPPRVRVATMWLGEVKNRKPRRGAIQ